MRGAPPPPPPIIFERLKLPQQIIYRRKENSSESPNHQKYWENILVSQFYEQFSRNRRNLGHFQKFEKISNSKNTNILYIILKRVIWRFQIYNLFREKFKFRGFTKASTNFPKYIIAFIFAKFKFKRVYSAYYLRYACGALRLLTHVGISVRCLFKGSPIQS